MPKTTKITISIPEELLEKIEKERMARGESRSESLRHAIESFLSREQEREDIERYIRGYQECPETEEEIALAQSKLPAAFAENPWGSTPER